MFCTCRAPANGDKFAAEREYIFYGLLQARLVGSASTAQHLLGGEGAWPMKRAFTPRTERRARVPPGRWLLGAARMIELPTCSTATFT